MSEYDWLEDRKLRSVDQLKLWPANPRLDPDEEHIKISDYASDLIIESAERDSFLRLVSSIVSDGFIPADPIVVWQDPENHKHYVAEGNRRILALKLLRSPDKAPKSIRSTIRKKSELIDTESFKKIRVCVAPSFDACEWYINQRHSATSIQRPWSMHQKMRWISGLYDKYDSNIDKVMSITRLNKSELVSTLRILKIRDWALNKEVLNNLSIEDQERVKSHRLPMSIFERWFNNLIIKEKWGIEFDEDNVKIVSNKKSFYVAYTKFIALVLHRSDPDVEIRIDTRTITSDFDAILLGLPKVSFETSEDPQANEESSGTTGIQSDQNNENNGNTEPNTNEKSTDQTKATKPPTPLSKDPNRPKLVVRTCKLTTSNYKLSALLKEFKDIPIEKYKNCLAASLRVFLDLAISEYTSAESCRDGMKKAYTSEYYDIPLKKRLEYLKSHNLKSKKSACKVLEKLLNHSNTYSLDVLNNYIHGKDTHHTGKQHLNGFWDFLFPLFEEILDIKEL